MTIGDVLYYPDFSFADGGHANKLLVVISDCTKEKIVMLIATSKGRDANVHGCQAVQKKFFIKAGSCGFVRDTWIDLDRSVFVFETSKVQEKINSGNVQIKHTLPQQIVNEIRNCIKRHAQYSLTREACELLGISPSW